jgi:hypothetical protein
MLTLAVAQAARAQRRRRADTLIQVRDLGAVLQAVSARLRQVSELVADLEQRIAEQPVTLATLHGVAERLESEDSTEILQALVDMLALCLPADAVSVYTLERDLLVLRAHAPPLDAASDSGFVAGHPILRAILSSGRTWNIRDALVEDARGTSAHPRLLIAAPLEGPHGLRLGVVTVDDMAFSRFDASAVEVVELIASWASRGLRRAALSGPGETASTPDQDIVLLSFAATMQRTWREIQRAIRYNHPLSVIVLCARPGTEVRLRRVLRATDIVGRHELPERVVCVLPETSSTQAHSVSERLAGALGEVAPAAYGVASLSDRTRSTAALLAAADAALSRRS